MGIGDRVKGRNKVILTPIEMDLMGKDKFKKDTENDSEGNY